MRRFGIVGISSAVLVACSGLIGTRDLFYDEDAGALSSEAGANDAAPPSTDAGSTDACSGNDFTGDPKNCGACGHDCLGGECVGSKCQPAVLVLGTFEPYAIDVDGTNVYWSDVASEDAGTVYSVPKYAVKGASTMIAQTADPLIYDLKVDTGDVYFASGSVSYSNGKGIVEACPTAGGAKRTVAKPAVPRGLAIDSERAYWVAVEGSPPTVQSASKNGDGTITTLSLSEPNADALVLLGQGLYWTQDRASDGSIRRCTSPVCMDEIDYIPTVDSPEALGVNGKFLFYPSGAGLYAIDTTTSGPGGAKIADNQPQTVSIVADDTDIYWLNTGTLAKSFADGDMRHCPIVSGAVACAVVDGEVLATSKYNPRIIVMDKTAVYWTVQREGTIYRLAR